MIAQVQNCSVDMERAPELMPGQLFVGSKIDWNDVEMVIFFPKVHFGVHLTSVFIPHDTGFGFVSPFEKIKSECSHH